MSIANYASVSGRLARVYPTYPIDPAMNFPPQQDYATRAVARYHAETQKIDAIMFRITDWCAVPRSRWVRRCRSASP